MHCLSLQFCEMLLEIQAATWLNAVNVSGSLELRVLTRNRSRLRRWRTCSCLFSVYFLWNTWLLCCLSLPLRDKTWKISKRPALAMCGELGLQEWWDLLICGEAGKRSGRKLAPKLGVVFVLVLSGSSSSSKYDPEILKAEIATTKSRVSSTNGPLLAMSNLQVFPSFLARTERRCQSSWKS